MNVSKRPLSPHLQIYKPQLTSVLSISHRLTGFALSILILFSPVILYLLTASKDTYAIITSIFENGFIKILLSLALFGMVYHLFNGIRHLAWDAGYGLDIDDSYKSGYLVLAASIVISLLIVFSSGIF